MVYLFCCVYRNVNNRILFVVDISVITGELTGIYTTLMMAFLSFKRENEPFRAKMYLLATEQ